MVRKMVIQAWLCILALYQLFPPLPHLCSRLKGVKRVMMARSTSFHGFLAFDI